MWMKEKGGRERDERYGKKEKHKEEENKRGERGRGKG